MLAYGVFGYAVVLDKHGRKLVPSTGSRAEPQLSLRVFNQYKRREIKIRDRVKKAYEKIEWQGPLI